MQHDPWRTFKSVALPFNLSDLDFKTHTVENADIISVHSEAKRKGGKCKQLLVFSVTPFKIDQNKNQDPSIDKVQILVNEGRYIYKDPRQDSGRRNISYTRYPKKCFAQTYRDLYGDAMLVLTWMSSNMADGNQQKHLLPSFATKA